MRDGSLARRALSGAGEWLPIAGTVVVGPALMAAAALVHAPKLTLSIQHGTPSDWLFRSGLIVLLVASGSVAIRDRRRAAQLRELTDWQNRASDSERALAALAREEVRRLADSLRLYSNGRVSLFRAHEDDHFDLVARYSADPSKDHGSGRAVYAMDEGVLGLAWTSQRAFPPALPSPGPLNGAPQKQWVDAQRRVLGVSEADAASLTLRARTYAAVRVDSGGHSLGVLVFEDTRQVAPDGAAADPSASSLTESEVAARLDVATGERIALLLRNCYGIPCEAWTNYRKELGTPGPVRRPSG